MMEQANKLGPNRTGMNRSPKRCKEMVEGAEALTDTTVPSREHIAEFHAQAIEEYGHVGSVPMPASLKGALTAGKEKLKGHNPEMLINKLGQRLAFERMGTRLYDALIIKRKAVMDDDSAQIVTLEKLIQFRDEEHEHSKLVASVLEDLGADPTAVTPDANVSALAAMGLTKVLTEPRTTLLQSLEAIQIAELADNVAWVNLQELCLSMGLEDISEKFSEPIMQEKVHQEVVSDWISQLVHTKSRA